MDAFGDNFVDEPEADPAAEFLAREQDQLAGLEDEIPPVAAPTPTVTSNEIDEIPASVPAVAPIEDDADDFAEAPLEATVEVSNLPAKEEPEKIKKWREEQKARLEKKDAEEETKKSEWREAAKKELEEWYEQHAETISKTKSTNRNAEKQFVAEADEVQPGTEWERIAKLCEFNPKSSRTSKDVSRMRTIILQLKQAPLVPVNCE